MMGKAHNVIEEAKREGSAAIVSNKFGSNYAYFQIVMLSYNIWRLFKMIAGHSQLVQGQKAEERKLESKCVARGVMDGDERCLSRR